MFLQFLAGWISVFIGLFLVSQPIGSIFVLNDNAIKYLIPDNSFSKKMYQMLKYTILLYAVFIAALLFILYRFLSQYFVAIIIGFIISIFWTTSSSAKVKYAVEFKMRYTEKAKDFLNNMLDTSIKVEIDRLVPEYINYIKNRKDIPNIFQKEDALSFYTMVGRGISTTCATYCLELLGHEDVKNVFSYNEKAEKLNKYFQLSDVFELAYRNSIFGEIDDAVREDVNRRVYTAINIAFREVQNATSMN